MPHREAASPPSAPLRSFIGCLNHWIQQHPILACNLPTSPDLLHRQTMCTAPLNILSTNLGGHASTAAMQATGKPTAHTPRGSQPPIQDPHCLGHLIQYAKGRLSVNLSPFMAFTTSGNMCHNSSASWNHPKALQKDNAWEFASTTFTSALTRLRMVFFPSLHYLPQENGKEERLNWMLGDMARAMMVQIGMPERFWKFEYSSMEFLVKI
ncbi:hypothetical protein O181_066965 [Austropuccinia psidii MF-1]|uniref:Uncharacterized protein n=1 Tax=Austropuccinia psidii MF-1 TaxID=1389203 RepID=A0A9Q3EPX6_9BASI|nr:hypothetical protein [Austropuccinia psidii MF-1]